MCLYSCVCVCVCVTSLFHRALYIYIHTYIYTYIYIYIYMRLSETQTRWIGRDDARWLHLFFAVLLNSQISLPHKALFRISPSFSLTRSLPPSLPPSLLPSLPPFFPFSLPPSSSPAPFLPPFLPLSCYVSGGGVRDRNHRQSSLHVGQLFSECYTPRWFHRLLVIERKKKKNRMRGRSEHRSRNDVVRLSDVQ